MGRDESRWSRLTAARGETWLVDLGEPVGHEAAGSRPAVIVSENLWNDGPGGVVIVVPMTTVGRGLPTQIEIDDPSAGLHEVSYARCEDVRSVSTSRLVTRLGAVTATDLGRMEQVLRFLLGL